MTTATGRGAPDGDRRPNKRGEPAVAQDPSLTLLHHAPADDKVWSTDYVTYPAEGHPPITTAVERALRRRCAGPLDKATEPVRWHHCEGWGAVLDLHHAGRHDDAMDVARLLFWCDGQFNGRSRGAWEIRRVG